MKILFLSNGDKPDYQQDTVFHGLRSLLGPDVVDYHRLFFMYKDDPCEKASLYGRGFSLYKTLPSDADVDRTDIIAKFFDLIVYGNINRCQAFWGGVNSIYPPHKIVLLDGEDHPYALKMPGYPYFKRELGGDPYHLWMPIHFGIPKEKIPAERPAKTKFMADYDPLTAQSYTFENEADYYQGYAESYFGATMRKSGWECMRHTEILSQWCLPYFRLIEAAPPLTMHRLPRRELVIVKELIEYGEAGCLTAVQFYDRVIDSVMAHVRANLTTEAVAKYALDSVASFGTVAPPAPEAGVIVTSHS